MSKKRTRVWPEPAVPLVAPVMDNHTHLPVHEGEIPTADGVKLSLEEQLTRAAQANVTHLISSESHWPCTPMKLPYTQGTRIPRQMG